MESESFFRAIREQLQTLPTDGEPFGAHSIDTDFIAAAITPSEFIRQSIYDLAVPAEIVGAHAKTAFHVAAAALDPSVPRRVWPLYGGPHDRQRRADLHQTFTELAAKTARGAEIAPSTASNEQAMDACLDLMRVSENAYARSVLGIQPLQRALVALLLTLETEAYRISKGDPTGKLSPRALFSRDPHGARRQFEKKLENEQRALTNDRQSLPDYIDVTVTPGEPNTCAAEEFPRVLFAANDETRVVNTAAERDVFLGNGWTLVPVSRVQAVREPARGELIPSIVAAAERSAEVIFPAENIRGPFKNRALFVRGRIISQQLNHFQIRAKCKVSDATLKKICDGLPLKREEDVLSRLAPALGVEYRQIPSN